MESKSDILNIDQASEILQISKYTLYKLVKRKEIPFSKIGKQIRFSRQSLEEFIRKGE